MAVEETAARVTAVYRSIHTHNPDLNGGYTVRALHADILALHVDVTECCGYTEIFGVADSHRSVEHSDLIRVGKGHSHSVTLSQYSTAVNLEYRDVVIHRAAYVGSGDGVFLALLTVEEDADIIADMILCVRLTVVYHVVVGDYVSVSDVFVELVDYARARGALFP